MEGKGDVESADRRGIYADEERNHGKRDGFEVVFFFFFYRGILLFKRT